MSGNHALIVTAGAGDYEGWLHIEIALPDVRAARAWLEKQASDGTFSIVTLVESGIRVQVQSENVVKRTVGSGKSFNQRKGKRGNATQERPKPQDGQREHARDAQSGPPAGPSGGGESRDGTPIAPERTLEPPAAAPTQEAS